MSNNEKVALFPGATTAPSEITLEGVVQQMEDWRAHKKSVSEPIPEGVWEQLTVLSKTIPVTDLRRATKIGTTQWNRRFKETSSRSVPAKKTVPQPMGVQQMPSTRAVGQSEKIPTLTLMVEFSRPDGRTMKIQATSDQLADLMTAFFAGN